MAKHCDFCFRVAIFLTFAVYLVEGKYLLMYKLLNRTTFIYVSPGKTDGYKLYRFRYKLAVLSSGSIAAAILDVVCCSKIIENLISVSGSK